MFTGIIQNQAKLVDLKPRGGQIHFLFRFLKKEKRPLELGESIAVNGVCLTAAKVGGRGFEADAVAETLKATCLGFLKNGDVVNTERALRYGDPLGGHFVTGHVDAKSQMLGIQKKAKNIVFAVRTPQALSSFIAVKGSIVVDGVSLTVQAVKGNGFECAIVPHTLRATNLSKKKTGDWVNLEVDLIARYLHRMESVSKRLAKAAGPDVTIKQLKRLGF